MGSVVIITGDYINGSKIKSIELDPFIPGQIDIFTEKEEINFNGDRSLEVFRIRKGEHD